jgi:C4-dicarboxylate-specific signal transduction histidine kinase
VSRRAARRVLAAALPPELRALLDALPMPALLSAVDGEVLHANAAQRAAGEADARQRVPLELPGLGACVLALGPPSGPANAQTQRLASLGFIVAGVCHEVSNPLSAVSSMVQILQSRRGVNPETIEKGLASISANVARVHAITKKLGDFSRVTGDAPAALEIDEAVEAAALLLRHSPSGHDVALEYRGAPGARVLARASELQQVIFNVLLNATQAMHGTGRIEAAARLEGARVLLSVRDHGPGIAQEHLPRLFDPFFTTKQPGEGTGLGLAISYEIVHELGGTIRAANHAQGGALFEIVLPGSRAA